MANPKITPLSFLLFDKTAEKHIETCDKTVTHKFYICNLCKKRRFCITCMYCHDCKLVIGDNGNAIQVEICQSCGKYKLDFNFIEEKYTSEDIKCL